MTTCKMSIAAWCVLLFISLAHGGDFKATAVLEGPQIRKAGEEISVKVTGVYPDDYVISGWQIIAYLPSLPEGFAGKAGMKVSENKDPKWSNVTIVPWTWLSDEMKKSNVQMIRFNTTGWPKGDYSLQSKLIIRVKAKPEVATDKYVPAQFVFSLE